MRVPCGILLVLWAEVLSAQTSPAPFYTTSSIVNAASTKLEELAPNTLATIYGKDLAYITRALSGEDIRDGLLPTALPLAGVRVLVGKVAAPILFVSPNQVNFLVPSSLTPGSTEVQLGLDGRFGAAVKVKLAEASPALFTLDPEFVIAARADGSLVTRDAPARGGEVVVLYGTGLGVTKPRAPLNAMVVDPGVLARIEEFRVWIGGAELPRDSVLYAGTTPGFAGLYQINVVLPEGIGQNPEVRIGFGVVLSPPGLRLHAR